MFCAGHFSAQFVIVSSAKALSWDLTVFQVNEYWLVAELRRVCLKWLQFGVSTGKCTTRFPISVVPLFFKVDHLATKTKLISIQKKCL